MFVKQNKFQNWGFVAVASLYRFSDDSVSKYDIIYMYDVPLEISRIDLSVFNHYLLSSPFDFFFLIA